jgi:1-aminocyclopropane-1-carboxylate synthase
VAGSGCGSVIDLLVSCIADDGDGILVSLPHYNGFVSSFFSRNAVVAVGVELEPGKEADESALEAYERKLVESEAQGIAIKAIMLCNPHNPLGKSLQLLLASYR